MVSIILITCNRLDFLKQTIKSIFKEKQTEFELIIWDNCSSDGTKDYLKSLNFPNIKIIFHDKNIGQNAYNSMVRLSKGDYILEIDDDILDLPENWLSTMLNAYNKIPNIGYLASDVVQDKYTNGAKPDIKNYKLFKYKEWVFEEGPAGGWCTLFSREIYNAVGGFLEFENIKFYGEDGNFSEKIRLKGYRAGLLRNVKAYHATGPILNKPYKNLYNEKMQEHKKFLDTVLEENLNKKEILLSVIIINWQVKEYLSRCLLSINKFYYKKKDIEIIVVDNASTDGSVSMLRKEFPYVKLIVNLDNKGFARANNQALKVSSGKYILFLNPDTELIEDSFSRMIKFLEDNDMVGAVGCKLIYQDSSFQESIRKFPTVDIALWQHHGDFLLKNPQDIIDKYYMRDMDYGYSQEVDQPMGAALMVKRKALEEIGFGMDERFFMFFDEVDLCYRLKRRGWKIMYYSETSIIHHQAKSIDTACDLGIKVDQEFHKSMFKFLWKYYYKSFIKMFILYILFYYNKIFRIPARTL